MLLNILDFFSKWTCSFIPTFFTTGLKYNFSNFMSIYIYVVPLLFHGWGGDHLLVSSYLAFFSFSSSTVF